MSLCCPWVIPKAPTSLLGNNRQHDPSQQAVASVAYGAWGAFVVAVSGT